MEYEVVLESEALKTIESNKGYDQMMMVRAVKTVLERDTSLKAPRGRHRIRIVVYGTSLDAIIDFEGRRATVRYFESIQS